MKNHVHLAIQVGETPLSQITDKELRADGNIYAGVRAITTIHGQA